MPPAAPDATQGDPLPTGGPQRVAFVALVAGVVILLLKFGVFWVTDSVAVLGDALESLVNIAAAGTAIFSTWYAAQPPDSEHPYGHGNIEFIAVGAEGAMVAMAGGALAVEAARRLGGGSALGDLAAGAWLLGGVSVLMALLGAYVWRSGVRLGSPTLVADGKHLTADCMTTFGVIAGLALVRLTGVAMIDSLVALALAGFILLLGARLVIESYQGIMARADPRDDAAIRAILDQEAAAGAIVGYHKVKHHHNGTFHWVDMHLQVAGDTTVRDAHALASRIEERIEQRLGRAYASAHVEPADAAPEAQADAPGWAGAEPASAPARLADFR
ncbi:MAG: cation transporter [Planctomycetes bacterium]|nr:cation transporter [Planctomycetota bacterium]